MIFNINLQEDFNTDDGVNYLRIYFDNAYLREVKDPDVVPLPAAGWLLLGAVGALPLARRRRRTS